MIPVILGLAAAMSGAETDLFLPRGLPHSGEYDLQDLFDWVDRICA